LSLLLAVNSQISWFTLKIHSNTLYFFGSSLSKYFQRKMVHKMLHTYEKLSHSIVFVKKNILLSNFFDLMLWWRRLLIWWFWSWCLAKNNFKLVVVITFRSEIDYSEHHMCNHFYCSDKWLLSREYFAAFKLFAFVGVVGMSSLYFRFLLFSWKFWEAGKVIRDVSVHVRWKCFRLKKIKIQSKFLNLISNLNRFMNEFMHKQNRRKFNMNYSWDQRKYQQHFYQISLSVS
jgi:hypothetical protein